MSTILKALKRLEEEKSIPAERPLREDVLVAPAPRSRPPRWLVPVAAGVGAFALVIGALMWLGIGHGAAGPGSTAQAVPPVATSAQVSQREAPAPPPAAARRSEPPPPRTLARSEPRVVVVPEALEESGGPAPIELMAPASPRPEARELAAPTPPERPSAEATVAPIATAPPERAAAAPVEEVQPAPSPVSAAPAVQARAEERVATPSVPQLLEVRVGRHPDRTRVVLELDAPAAHEVTGPPSPQSAELIVWLPAESAAREIPSSSPLVRAVRVEPEAGGSRIRVALRDGDVQLHEMVLSDPYRIVFDLASRDPTPPSRVARAPDPAAGSPPAHAEPAEPAPSDPAVPALEPESPSPAPAALAPERSGTARSEVVAGSDPSVVVERTSWHPSADRRRAWVQVEGRTLEVREGDRVGSSRVVAIEPASVRFDRDGVESTQRVGATP